ncbi:hypothetical protein D3C84_1072900 [compost metagenome]
MAFSTASAVMMSRGRISCRTSSTICLPVRSERCLRRLSGAGIAAQPGSAMPMASAIEAMVLAVPITMQCPSLRQMASSATASSSSVIFPALCSSVKP